MNTRKTTLLLAILILGLASTAQQTDTVGSKLYPAGFSVSSSYDLIDITPVNDHQPIPYGYMLINDKMMLIKNGSLTFLEKDITLINGMQILRDGTIIKKDGTSRKLKEHEHVDILGKTVMLR